MNHHFLKSCGALRRQWIRPPVWGFLVVAVCALLFTLGDVWRPLTQRGHLLVFEVEINSSREGETQVFWNHGRGYRGRYSSSREITRPQEWYSLVLPLTGRSIDGLRLDPLDGESVIHLRNMRVRTLGGRTLREFGPDNIGETEFIQSVETVGAGETIRVTVGQQHDPQFVFDTDYPIRAPISIPRRYGLLGLHFLAVGLSLYLLWRFARRWGWRGPGTFLALLIALAAQGILGHLIYTTRLFPLPLGQTIFQLVCFSLIAGISRPVLHRLGKMDHPILRMGRVISTPPPGRLWLLLGGGFGLVMVFLTPPYQSPDEYNWFNRAFHISEGNWFPEVHEREASGGGTFRDAGGLFPEDLRSLLHWTGGTGIVFRPHIKADLANIVAVRDKFNESEPREFQHLRDTLHSLPPYLPQAAGIRLVREMGGHLLDQFYGGRLGNLLVCLALGWLVMRTYPPMAWVFMVVFCNPLSLFLIASNSHDPLVNLLCALAMALVLRTRERPGRIGWSEWAGLLGVFLLILISKFNYIVLLPLLLLIPAHRFNGWRHRLVALGGVAGLTAAGLLLLFFALRFYPSGDWGQPDIDRRERLLHVLTHPWETLSLYVNTIGNFGPDYAQQIGGILGWLDTDIGGAARWLWVFAAVLGTAFMAFHHRRLPLGWLDRAVVFSTGLVAFLSILAIFLLVWTPTGIAHIVGVQGRYFIVLLPLLAVCLSPVQCWPERWANLFRLAIIVLVFCSLSLTLFWCYYRYWMPLPVVEY